MKHHNIKPKSTVNLSSSNVTQHTSATSIKHNTLSGNDNRSRIPNQLNPDLNADQVIIAQISQIDPNLPKPKLLKSCIRCRKHKTKCDAQVKSPAPCSSCTKKGCLCKIDYVLPPQRSDNLKNLMNQVDFIKEQYDLLSNYYTEIGKNLGIDLMSFQDWKSNREELECIKEEASDADELMNGNSNNAVAESMEDINLIKLSDGSFISINWTQDSNQLNINNNLIDLNELEVLIKQVLIKLNLITSIFQYNNSESVLKTPSITYSSDTDDSVSSPIFLNNDAAQFLTKSSSTVDSELPESSLWLDLKFDIKTLIKSNKFLLIQLISNFYPELSNSINFKLFLSDYLSSYYSIVETLNKSLNTSTYSSNLLMSTLTSKTNKIVFNKNQLRNLIDVDIFNSELYLKKLMQLLFLNVLSINSIRNSDMDNVSILNNFMKFIDQNINNNRKKLNFDKNEDLKFIEKFMGLLNLIKFDYESNHFEEVSTRLQRSYTKTQSDLTEELTDSNYKSLEELTKLDLQILKKLIRIEQETNGSRNNFIKVSPSNISPAPSLFNSINTPNRLLQSGASVLPIQILTNKFNKFLNSWSKYFNLINLSSTKLFIDEFILEFLVLNILIILIESNSSSSVSDTYEFQSILKNLANFHINPSLNSLICWVLNGDFEKEVFITENDFSSREMFKWFELIHTSLTRQTKDELTSIPNSETANNNIDTNISNLQEPNDIQIILENVDWRKESTDDVLKKIGVI